MQLRMAEAATNLPVHAPEARDPAKTARHGEGSFALRGLRLCVLCGFSAAHEAGQTCTKLPAMPSQDVLETLDATGQGTLDGSVLAGPRGRLVAVHPPELHSELDLDAGATVLGRSGEPPDQVAIHHPKLSRTHLEISWDSAMGRFTTRDLESRNGSWLDGDRLEQRSKGLQDGSVLRLGDVIFVFEAGHSLSPDSKEVDRSAIPGRSLPARALRESIARAAPDPSPVLVLGETGTGKESIAKELHRLSRRSGRFVAINCSTLGAQLAESQLFGHKKGAFTGASQDQEGLFLAADRGTLFLDELGELPIELQPKLLRAIQEREIRAVGSTRDVKVDVRVVAATHRDLAQAVANGAFRQDLFARLALWEVRAPPIRARRADVLGWVSRLSTAWQRERGISAKALELSSEAAERLLLFDWPENLRGIVRLVHELAARKTTGPLRPKDLPRFIERAP